VVCFRLRGSNEENRRLLETINGSRRFFISHTVLNDRFVLRIAIGNLRTSRETLAELWEEISRLASPAA
jgi:aromatic-L-amino-acid decarboxylase